jgi:SHS2 domain-containing protein
MSDPAEYRVHGRGSDLAIEARGADAVGCLRAVVAGFAAALAETDEISPRERLPVVVRADGPQALLVELVEELILAIDADGVLPLDLVDAEVGEDDGTWSLEGTLRGVALADVEVHGAAPKAATWHDVRFAPSGEGWGAYVMVDI